MNNHNEEEFFEHYGIKGMKWGVRRDNPSGKTPPKSAGRDKSLSSISDKELQARINRLNMEKNYKKLIEESSQSEKSALEKGGRIVGKVVADAAKQEISNYARKKFKVAIKNGAPKVAAYIAKEIVKRR